jgi:hypothetical protein
MQIGRVAQSTGLSVDTIRFYEKQSLIPPAQRTDAGYRVYDESTVDRLQFIGRAQSRLRCHEADCCPIVGGMITSTIHVLILVPVFFVMKERALKRGTLVPRNKDSTSTNNDSVVQPSF